MIMASVYTDATYSCYRAWTQHTDRMFGSITEQLKTESDGHGSCGSRVSEPAGTSHSTKQLRQCLFRSYCPMHFRKLISLSIKHDLRLPNNMTASCLRLWQLHIK